MTPLRQRMREDMQVRNLSPHTQPGYIENVARFAKHFGRSPADLGAEEIRTHQVYLINERHLSRPVPSRSRSAPSASSIRSQPESPSPSTI
jgi:Phage integrase, N-terminal SAM-like domain